MIPDKVALTGNTNMLALFNKYYCSYYDSVSRYGSLSTKRWSSSPNVITDWQRKQKILTSFNLVQWSDK